MTTPKLSRRQLLRRLGAAGATSAASPWLMNLAALAPARAASAGGYKALVCLFMYGGNDAYNTVLATDQNSWSAYLAARNADTNSIALAAPGTAAVKGGSNYNAQLGGVLPIAPRSTQQGRAFALHPQLAAVRDLFASGRVAILSNVGPLVQATSWDSYNSKTAVLPPKLFSHNDQQSVWESMKPEGSTIGWGGQFVDRFVASNANPLYSSISTGSNSVWLSGNAVRPYSLSLSGPIHLGGSDGTLFGSAAAQQALQKIVSSTRETQYFEQDHATIGARSIAAETQLSPLMPAAGLAPWGTPGLPVGTPDPLLNYKAPITGAAAVNPITAQLQVVARMIATNSSLGMGRQVFFVGVQGFDTHEDQSARHADMLAQLAQAMSYWDTVTRSMGVDQQVTTFTASDFGRTFASNGDGTDHGWGGHHFVMGGAVKGGDLYGRFPTYGLTDGQGVYSSHDQVQDGSLLPLHAVEQYAATLGTWMGLSNADLQAIMPNLGNWNQSEWNLGFMKT